MVSSRRVILVLTLLVSPLVIAALAAAQSSPAPDLARGKELYARYCSGCHGEDGRGEAKTFRPNVGNLSVKMLMDQLSDDYLVAVIQKGGAAVGKNAAMPAWSAQLDDADIRDVVAFVRTLARR
jgi:mono/diheme cytochrome c family protein